MSRLLDQIRNAARLRLGVRPQQGDVADSAPANAGGRNASASSSLLVQAMQRDAAAATRLHEAAGPAMAQPTATAPAAQTPTAARHHLPRLAIAVMIAAAVFGLGYWTGLPDPGAPGTMPVPAVHADVPLQLELRFDRDVDGIGQRLESAGRKVQSR